MRNYCTIFFAVGSLLNIGVLFLSFHLWRAAAIHDPSSVTLASAPASNYTIATHKIADALAEVEALPIAYVPFYWNTPWGAPNATEADPLWDNINTAHGHIAVDHEWAAAHHVSESVKPSFWKELSLTRSVGQWPRSMDIPGKPGKGMYLLQAYHQLHCLVSLC